MNYISGKRSIKKIKPGLFILAFLIFLNLAVPGVSADDIIEQREEIPPQIPGQNDQPGSDIPQDPQAPDHNNPDVITQDDIDAINSNQRSEEDENDQADEPPAQNADDSNIDNIVNPPSEFSTGSVPMSIDIDWSNVDDSKVPDMVEITVIPGGVLLEAVQFPVSAAGNWHADASIPKTDGDLLITYGEVAGVSFALNGDLSNGFTLVAQDAATAPPSEDPNLRQDTGAQVVYNPPTGEVAKPAADNIPGEKLLIKSPKARRHDPGVKNEENDKFADGEEAQKLQREIENRDDQYIYYVIGGVALLILVAGAVFLRFKLR